MRKAFIKILFFFNLLAIVALCISYLAVHIPPDSFWIPSLFGLAYPFIVLANLLFVVFWVFVKAKNALLSLVFVLAGWSFIERYFQVNAKESDDAGVKVVSYNVGSFVDNGAENADANAKAIVAFLVEQKPDIVCIQESRLRKNNIFNLPETIRKMESIKHYQYARSSNTFGMVTMTRFPIVNMQEIRFEESTNMAIFTDVVMGKDTVRIFNVHLQSYKIDPNQYTIIDSPGITEEEDREQVKEMGLKFKAAFEQRAVQVREIRKIIDESPYEILLCGDFNDTPASFSYKIIGDNLQDAFVASGKGVGRTYVGKLPSFRIDYIFYSAGFAAYNFKTWDFYHSDHLPISCTLLRTE